jgi:hypothetical protein
MFCGSNEAMEDILVNMGVEDMDGDSTRVA